MAPRPKSTNCHDGERPAHLRISGMSMIPRPALIAPSTVRAPSVTTTTTKKRLKKNPKSAGCAIPFCVASSPPPSPAIPAETANARMRARAGLIPIDWAATSLPRNASRNRPVVPLRMSTTSPATAASTSTQNRKNILSSSRPAGRGTRRGRMPPPTQSKGTNTLSNISANASVASERNTPPRRKAGIASSAPTAAASAAPTSRVGSTPRPQVSTICAVANAPMPAKVAWESETCPPIPVMTVIDRKIVAKMAAWVKISSYWLLIFTQAAIFATIFLSITVITGMGGQVSLSQATFAGIGAFATAQIVDTWGLGVLPTLLVGAALAAAVGALLAIPALRLGGVFLSLATLAFALMFESVFVPLDWVGGGIRPLRVPRPAGLNDDKMFFLFCVLVLAAVAGLVVLIRKGTTGRFLDALRGSDVAAQSIGINPARARILAFAVSAGIAGLGGGLLATQKGIAQPADFGFFFSLFFVVVVVTLGARTVEGAISAGLGIMLMPEILKWAGLSPSWQFVLFGLGAITYARHPEGVLESNKRRSLAFVERRLPRRWRGRRRSTN